MKGLVGFLEFTMETGEQFEDGWLPTLDTSLKMSRDNQVHFRFYQNPMANRQVLHRDTSMAENPKIQCLANDLSRRMLMTSESVPMNVRLAVIDDYARIRMPTASVIFIDQTHGGELAIGLRDIMQRLEGTVGFRFKVEESLRVFTSRAAPYAMWTVRRTRTRLEHS